MRFHFFPAALALLAASGCSSDSSPTAIPENQLMATDFESMTGWTPDVPSLTREKAHSGKYSIKTDPNIEYSLTYQTTLGALSPTKLTKVRLTAYAYVKKAGSPATLTFQLLRSLPEGGAAFFMESIDMSKTVKKAGEWTKVTQDIVLPADVAATSILRLYIWRASSSDAVYVDDIVLTKE